MKILFVAAEVAPLARVGGLGEVVGSLPKALKKLGHDVRIIIPKHEGINLEINYIQPVSSDYEIEGIRDNNKINLWLTYIDNMLPVYLVENTKYFDKEIYGKNELEKYFFFSTAVSHVLSHLNWQPDILHCHDWHTALTVMWRKKLNQIYGTVFTIHNMNYQGWFDQTFLKQHDLFTDTASLGPDMSVLPDNFLSRGIRFADFITTVSENYAREVTTAEYGEGLESLLLSREKSFKGITNGIDYENYNPATDKNLVAKYTLQSIEKRQKNKISLQQKVRLPQSLETPLIGMVQRLDEQKGVDIFIKAVDRILEMNVQLVILGAGRESYEESLKKIAAKYPDKMAVVIGYDDSLAHLIYGGCDIFLMPSKFEPCGLAQMIAMRYGAIPVVHHTGGLADTVFPLNGDLSQGSGFVFYDYSTEALITAVEAAISAYNQKAGWGMAIRRIMQIDFSWEKSARKYEDVYNRVFTIN